MVWQESGIEGMKTWKSNQQLGLINLGQHACAGNTFCRIKQAGWSGWGRGWFLAESGILSEIGIISQKNR